MKLFRVILFFLVAITFQVWSVEAQENNFSSDTNRVSSNIGHYYFQNRDTDSIYYVLIDSSLISGTDTIQKLVLSKYKGVSFNFMDSTLKVDNRKFVNRNSIKIRKTENPWMIYLLLFVVFLYTIIRNLYDKTLVVIFQAYWNDRAISQFTRDDNFLKLRNTLLYFILFTTVYALLIKNLLHYFDITFEYKGFQEYLFICVFTGLFYLLKFILMKFSGFIFSIQKLISGYLSIISISNFVYSIIIIPMLLFYEFVPNVYQTYLMGIILVLFCFNTIYKYLRTASFIINNFQFPKFYLFIYLCTLEIMPLLIIYKIYIA